MRPSNDSPIIGDRAPALSAMVPLLTEAVPVPIDPDAPLRSAADGTEDPTLSETKAVPHNLKIVRQSGRRRFLNLIQVKNAVEHIQKLPAAGQTLHMVNNARWKGFDLIPAVCDLIGAGHVIDDLTVTTLSFSQDNAAELLKLMDAGRIGRVSFLCSQYFEKSDGPIYQFLAGGLAARGPRHRLAACRNHTKIVLAHTTAEHWLVAESSSNLRSAFTLEQTTLANARDLFAFHAEWIEAVLQHGYQP